MIIEHYWTDDEGGRLEVAPLIRDVLFTTSLDVAPDAGVAVSLDAAKVRGLVGLLNIWLAKQEGSK